MFKQNQSDTKVRHIVSSEFIYGRHMSAIEKASAKGRFAVSFRAAGRYTLGCLALGAAAKGHNILEKTIKPSSIDKCYSPEVRAEKWRMIQQARLDGYVGHWQNNALVGVYLSSRHRCGNLVQNGIYPIDMTNQERLNSSIERLRAGPNWQKQVYTGDYDTHDMITFRGAGRPRTVLVNSTEEKNIIEAINLEVSKVDPHRPPQAIEYNVVRHGPQVNFSSYMMAHERQSVALLNGFPGAVARPGEFPLAVCDRGRWSIIENLRELELFYASVKAVIKESWASNGVRTYKDTENGMVRLGRP
jgi:insecticidal toxin complex protein TccC